MWVNAPLPVMSPIAHNHSLTRIRSSTSMNRPEASTPTSSSPMPSMRDSRHLRVRMQRDPLIGEYLRDKVGRFGFFGTEDAKSSLDDRHLGAEPREHLREFQPDRPATHHHH